MQGESNDNSLQVFEAWEHCEKGGSVKVLKYWTFIKDCCVFFFSKVGLTHTKLHKIIYMTTKSRGKKKGKSETEGCKYQLWHKSSSQKAFKHSSYQD